MLHFGLAPRQLALHLVRVITSHPARGHRAMFSTNRATSRNDLDYTSFSCVAAVSLTTGTTTRRWDREPTLASHQSLPALQPFNRRMRPPAEPIVAHSLCVVYASWDLDHGGH
ncbi:hypothetical protein FIBSPDRAFT_30627 [Athelia psychrophila]|uniref:Uncharacterized protein n=1 Tax=Athelia psychrophila TaxID=1759441 RepID=A0A166G272_9AGAM|nr:hypothetical protein FIBSPDRAFT_30627 [Fibularhizoctonia sp. CBS 109695]